MEWANTPPKCSHFLFLLSKISQMGGGGVDISGTIAKFHQNGVGWGHNKNGRDEKFGPNLLKFSPGLQIFTILT